MGNFGFGFHVLFRIWRDDDFAGQVKKLEEGKLAPIAPKAEAKPAPPPKPARSDAISLLSVLQREARFIDFIKEPISAYSDAQIGAAVRDVHKGCAGTLDRMFGIEPLLNAAEGSSTEVPRGFDPAQYHVTGNVANEPPYRGRLAHHGWKATRCELPVWHGSEASANVVAPAEVEIQ